MTPDIAIAWLLFNVFLVVLTLIWGIFRFRKGIWYRKLLLQFQAYFLWGIGGIALLSSIIPYSYLYTDHLWYFENVGYSEIFWKIRKVKWGLFAVFFFIALAFMNLNAFLANRLCPEPREFARWTHDRTVSFHRTFICFTVLIAIILAVPMMSLHDVFIKYLERPTEKIEPFLLGKDRNFFLFSFPLHQAVSLWVTILLWTTCFIVGLLYNYYYRRDARSKGYVKRNIVFHGSVLWLMLLAANIWTIYVHLWNRVYTSPITDNLTKLQGFFYMDLDLAGSTRVYSGILILIGAAILINLFTRKRIVWYMAIVVWGLSYLTLIHVYPSVSHWWNVKTVELDKEGDFLTSHIQSTRTAFDLNTIKEEDYNKEFATLEMVKENPEVVENIQLWDRHVLFDLLKADHLVRHYNFHRYTDVDRYRVGRPTNPETTHQAQSPSEGAANDDFSEDTEIEVSNEVDVGTGTNEQYRQVLIAAQEIDPDDVEGWRLQKLHFTHGYGVFMSPANDIENWDPIFWVKGIPYTLMEDETTESNETAEKVNIETSKQSRIYYNEKYPELQVTQPRIYYGEMTYDYVIANTTQPENDIEFKPNTNGAKETDNPTSEAIESKYHYDGTGGVRLGGWFRRLCFSIRFNTFRILRNEALQPESRVMYRRKIGTRHGKKMVTDRLSHIAPFLDYDPDPYIVINNGKLWWIVDFYVTSKHYPNAQFYEDDTSPSPDSNYVEPHYKRFKRFNYIRNSGVAVVNAYSGAVNFYAIKDSEVLTDVYHKAYKKLFKGIEEMPLGLREHLRFPDYLTRIQAKMYGVYHVLDPDEFFNRDDRWHIPTEFYYSDKPDQEIMPYYAMLKLPGETEIEFVNMVPFTPETKEFKMKAWLVSRCDPKHYGERIVYILSDPEGVAGPKQVEVEISNELADKIWAEKPKIRGNIQIFPIDGGIFYVEPVYLLPALDSQAGTSTDTVKKRPTLKEVFVAANRIASDQSFIEELKEIVVGEKVDESDNDETTTNGEDGEELTLAEQFDVLLKAVNDFGAALKAAEKGTSGNAKAAGNKAGNKKKNKQNK